MLFGYIEGYEIRKGIIMNLNSKIDIAMFPRGAINYPSLFVSTCVLFDKITVLHPIDLVHSRSKRYDFIHNHPCKVFPNKNADAFWDYNLPLIREGVLFEFMTEKDITPLTKSCQGSIDNPDLFDDIYDEHCILPGEIDFYYAIGFAEYFKYLIDESLPVMLSKDEFDSKGSFLKENRAKNIKRMSELSYIAIKVLNGCIPQLGIPQNAHSLTMEILEIRKHTKNERLDYLRFIGQLSTCLTELLSEGEKLYIINKLIEDSVGAWKNYSSKLSEVCRRLSIPIKFVSIIKSFLTLDLISLAKDTAASHKGLEDNNKQIRAFSYIDKVDKMNSFWLKQSQLK